MADVTWTDLGVYLILYSFLGWGAEVGYYAVARKKFYNRGLLSMPLILSYGVTSCLLILVLPTLSNSILRYLAILVITAVVERLSALLTRLATPKVDWGKEWERLFSGSGKGILASLIIAAVYYLTYLVVHPLLMAGVALIPPMGKTVAVIAVLVLAGLDMLFALLTLRAGDPAALQSYQEKSGWRQMVGRLSRTIWRRLDRAYPGIKVTVSPAERERYVFARGLCMDKLIWVFLLTALLGCIIEFFFCGIFNHFWVNRSSVLYGPFSFVWGLGAVVLTVSLQPLAEKSDRWVFAGGFVIGGVYEYMCSVFTELVFGTVFWDYSHMPLNIGGRTNVLFCFFWGVLAVIWVKMLYPALSHGIEKVPPIAGKVLTWMVVVFMLCDALLTSGAMLRYHSRINRPEPANVFEQFLDSRYDDGYMEGRWPNMRVTDRPEDKAG